MKNTLRKFSWLLLSLTAVLPVMAQEVPLYGFGNPADAKQLAERNLIIVLDELGKAGAALTPEQQAEASGYIATYNQDFEAAVKRFWKLSTGSESVTYAKAKSMGRSNKGKKPAYIRCVSIKYPAVGGSKFQNFVDWGFEDPKKKKKDKAVTFHYMEIGLIETIDKGYIIRVPLPNQKITKTDIAYGVTFLANYCEKMSNGEKPKSLVNEAKAATRKNTPKITSSTLLLRKDLLENPSKSEVEQVYPFEFKILATDQELGDAIFEGGDQYTYLVAIPIVTSKPAKNTVSFLKLVMDASNGDIVSMDAFKPSNVNMGTATMKDLLNGAKVGEKGFMNIKKYSKSKGSPKSNTDEEEKPKPKAKEKPKKEEAEEEDEEEDEEKPKDKEKEKSDDEDEDEESDDDDDKAKDKETAKEKEKEKPAAKDTAAQKKPVDKKTADKPADKKAAEKEKEKPAEKEKEKPADKEKEKEKKKKDDEEDEEEEEEKKDDKKKKDDEEEEEDEEEESDDDDEE